MTGWQVREQASPIEGGQKHEAVYKLPRGRALAAQAEVTIWNSDAASAARIASSPPDTIVLGRGIRWIADERMSFVVLNNKSEVPFPSFYTTFLHSLFLQVISLLIIELGSL